jgi:hypothetical protein
MDIVKRLKAKPPKGFVTSSLMIEASDEIERLRKRVKLLEGHLNGALCLIERLTFVDTADARQALWEKE